MRVLERGAAEPVQAAEEGEVLARREVRVDRQLLGHVADARLGGDLADVDRRAVERDLARRRAPAARRPSRSSSSCRRRSGRAGRRSRPRGSRSRRRGRPRSRRTACAGRGPAARPVDRRGRSAGPASGIGHLPRVSGAAASPGAGRLPGRVGAGGNRVRVGGERHARRTLPAPGAAPNVGHRGDADRPMQVRSGTRHAGPTDARRAQARCQAVASPFRVDRWWRTHRGR